MGLRFRKSIKLGKHTRLNLNKKSFGVSFGGKGARFTLNSKGRRTSTFGIPGTGLSYTTASGGKKKSRSKSKAKGRKVCGSSTGAAKPSCCLHRYNFYNDMPCNGCCYRQKQEWQWQ